MVSNRGCDPWPRVGRAVHCASNSASRFLSNENRFRYTHLTSRPTAPTLSADFRNLLHNQSTFPSLFGPNSRKNSSTRTL